MVLDDICFSTPLALMLDQFVRVLFSLKGKITVRGSNQNLLLFHLFFSCVTRHWKQWKDLSLPAGAGAHESYIEMTAVGMGKICTWAGQWSA